jgi:DNA mismatch endonuclease, patch repair protein
VTLLWEKMRYSRALSGRRGRDTEPERQLRRRLWRSARYRLHWRIAAGVSSDIAFPQYRVAVFVDGCFWHCCPKHGRRSISGPNAACWTLKMARNRVRDRQALVISRRLGWQVIRVWECDIRADAEAYEAAYGGPNGVPGGIDPTPFATGPMLPPAPEERGFKDTVKANPGYFTTIRAKFELPTDVPAPQDYVYHCHIVEHNDMMRPFTVTS